MKGSSSLPNETERDDGKSAVSVSPEPYESEEVKAMETPDIQAVDPLYQSADDQVMTESSTQIFSTRSQGSKGKTRRARVVSVISGSFRSRLPPLPATCPITRLEAAQSLEKLMENLTEVKKAILSRRSTEESHTRPVNVSYRLVLSNWLKLSQSILPKSILS